MAPRAITPAKVDSTLLRAAAPVKIGAVGSVVVEVEVVASGGGAGWVLDGSWGDSPVGLVEVDSVVPGTGGTTVDPGVVMGMGWVTVPGGGGGRVLVSVWGGGGV